MVSTFSIYVSEEKTKYIRTYSSHTTKENNIMAGSSVWKLVFITRFGDDALKAIAYTKTNNSTN